MTAMNLYRFENYAVVSVMDSSGTEQCHLIKDDEACAEECGSPNQIIRLLYERKVSLDGVEKWSAGQRAMAAIVAERLLGDGTGSAAQ